MEEYEKGMGWELWNTIKRLHTSYPELYSMVKDSPILELKMGGATVSQEEEINSGKWYVGGSPRQLSVLIVHLKDTQNSEKLLYAELL